jgi:ferredoxin
MRIVVDFDSCTSNAMCVAVAPDVFEVRDDGYLYVLSEERPESDRQRMERAVAACPNQAISIQED